MFVALSGVDCAGKSSQRDRLIEAFRAHGTVPVSVYARAGYTPGLKKIKAAARRLSGAPDRVPRAVSDAPNQYPQRASNLSNPMQRWLWLTFALLGVVWLYCIRIPVTIGRGRAVVCNRYLIDCIVDLRVNFPDEHVEERMLFKLLRRFAAKPDVAFCLLIPPEETGRRAREKSRFHWETPDVLERRWRAYVDLCKELQIETIDGMRPVEEIAAEIQHRVLGTPRKVEPMCARSD